MALLQKTWAHLRDQTLAQCGPWVRGWSLVLKGLQNQCNHEQSGETKCECGVSVFHSRDSQWTDPALSV